MLPNGPRISPALSAAVRLASSPTRYPLIPSVTSPKNERRRQPRMSERGPWGNGGVDVSPQQKASAAGMNPKIQFVKRGRLDRLGPDRALGCSARFGPCLGDFGDHGKWDGLFGRQARAERDRTERAARHLAGGLGGGDSLLDAAR